MLQDLYFHIGSVCVFCTEMTDDCMLVTLQPYRRPDD